MCSGDTGSVSCMHWYRSCERHARLRVHGRVTRARDLLPGQISVVGINDMLFMNLLSPALTTVRNFIETVGLEAADLLLKLIADPDQPARSIILPSQLVIRESTATPRILLMPSASLLPSLRAEALLRCSRLNQRAATSRLVVKIVASHAGSSGDRPTNQRCSRSISLDHAVALLPLPESRSACFCASWRSIAAGSCLRPDQEDVARLRLPSRARSSGPMPGLTKNGVLCSQSRRNDAGLSTGGRSRPRPTPYRASCTGAAAP